MKSFFIVALALFAMSAQAANIYIGGVNAGSVGATQAQTAGGSGAALIGIAGTTSNAGATQAGGAGGVVTPAGVVVAHGGVSNTTGASTSGALGAAAATSNYGGAAANTSGAFGFFRTLGIAP